MHRKVNEIRGIDSLRSSMSVSSFFFAFVHSNLMRSCEIVVVFLPPWLSFAFDWERLSRYSGLPNLVYAPYIYHYIPFEVYTERDDATQVIFEVHEEEFTVFFYNPHDILQTHCCRRCHLPIDLFVQLLHNAVDKQASACDLPPIDDVSDNDDLMFELTSLYYYWIHDSIQIIDWENSSGMMEVIFQTDIVWEIKRRMFFDVLDTAFASMPIPTERFGRFVVVGSGGFADFIRACFPEYKNSGYLVSYDPHEVLCANMSRLIVSQMIQSPPKCISSFMPYIRRVLSSELSQFDTNLGWFDCVARGGETILESEEKETSVQLSLSRGKSSTEVVGMMLTVPRDAKERGDAVLGSGMPQLFHSEGGIPQLFHSEDSASPQAVTGCLKDGALSGECRVEWSDQGVRYEGSIVDGRRCGEMRVLVNDQTVFTGVCGDSVCGDSVCGDSVCGDTACSDSVRGTGWWLEAEGKNYCGSFTNGKLHGVGCVFGGGEVDSGEYVLGEKEGVHVVSRGLETCVGVMTDNRWNSRVVRQLEDGGVALSNYVEGVLRDGIVWCDCEGGGVEGFVTTNDCVRVKYGRDGKKVCMEQYAPKQHSVDEKDDVWLLCGEGASHGMMSNHVFDPSDVECLRKLEDGTDAENEWVMKVEGGMVNDEESNLWDEEGECVEAPEPVEDYVLYPVQKGVSFEQHPSWTITWGKSGGNGNGEGVLRTDTGEVVYRGFFKAYLFDGAGCLYYTNKQKAFEGEFHGNVLSGRGRWYYPNGCLRYDGIWKEGQFDGNGILYKPVNLPYCNAEFRSFMRRSGVNSPFASTATDFDAYSM